jgi:hypothetical protein
VKYPKSCKKCGHYLKGAYVDWKLDGSHPVHLKCPLRRGIDSLPMPGGAGKFGYYFPGEPGRLSWMNDWRVSWAILDSELYERSEVLRRELNGLLHTWRSSI